MQEKELQGFLDAEGRLTAFPARRKKKVMALVYLAGRIPAGVEFSEKEFNQLLDTLHTFGDPALLWRELFDYGLIDREKAGSRYRLKEERPALGNLLERYR